MVAPGRIPHWINDATSVFGLGWRFLFQEIDMSDYLRRRGIHPITRTHDNSRLPESPGIDHRAYFAALALQGLLADPSFPHRHAEGFAKHAVILADALLEELQK
jgi:hypothetical protein